MDCLSEDDVSTEQHELIDAPSGDRMVNVLVVEDDLMIAALLSEALESEGYCVTGIARTVDSAIASAARTRPDFAIIDLRLAKGGRGIEVARHLRSEGDIGVIFSTGNDDHKLTADDGDAVMIKPYAMHEVVRALQIIGGTESTSPPPRNFRLLDPRPNNLD